MALYSQVSQLSDHRKQCISSLQFNIIWKKLCSKIDSLIAGVQR